MIAINDILLFLAGVAVWLLIGIYVTYRISVAKKEPVNEAGLMITAVILWPALIVMYWVETAMYGE